MLYLIFYKDCLVLLIKRHINNICQPSFRNIKSVTKIEEDSYSVDKYRYLKLFLNLSLSLNLSSDL
jgi:hypothetical protein